MDARGIARADLPGVTYRGAAHQHVARAPAPRDLCREIEHVGVPLTRPSSWGELESYASFVPRECGEAGVYVLIFISDILHKFFYYYYDKSFVLILR